MAAAARAGFDVDHSGKLELRVSTGLLDHPCFAEGAHAATGLSALPHHEELAVTAPERPSDLVLQIEDRASGASSAATYFPNTAAAVPPAARARDEERVRAERMCEGDIMFLRRAPDRHPRVGARLPDLALSPASGAPPSSAVACTDVVERAIVARSPRCRDDPWTVVGYRFGALAMQTLRGRIGASELELRVTEAHPERSCFIEGAEAATGLRTLGNGRGGVSHDFEMVIQLDDLSRGSRVIGSLRRDFAARLASLSRLSRAEQALTVQRLAESELIWGFSLAFPPQRL
jgi:hypothetical protein